MMRKSNITYRERGGSNVGISSVKRQGSGGSENGNGGAACLHDSQSNIAVSYPSLHDSQGNMSISYPMSPRTPRRPARPPFQFDRKDSDGSLQLDISENSTDSYNLMAHVGSTTIGTAPDLHTSQSHFSSGKSKRHRLKQAQKQQTLRPPVLIKLIAAIVCAAATLSLGIYIFQRAQATHDAALRDLLRRQEIGPLSKEMHEQLSDIRTENQELQKKLTEEQAEIGTLRKRTVTELPTLQEQVERLEKNKVKMHEAIQLMSRNRMLEKFGPGPHYIEVQLDFDPDSHLEGTADRFVLELAPADEMPHTVYWFLEQVDRGLYNLSSFHRNARHVIQAGPVGNHLTAPNAGLRKHFQESGFESVLFQEYSQEYRHYKYTLGYAGRPGGPDFYINMMDNSALHGPGGQSNYQDQAEADPCFARVVEGHEAVVRMHASDVDDGGYKHMVHNVAIRYMQILPANYTPAVTRRLMELRHFTDDRVVY